MSDLDLNIPTLFESHHCESCGWSFEELMVSYDSEQREWYGTLSTGCYGGDSVSGSRDDVINWLTNQNVRHYVYFTDLEEAVKKIREHKEDR